MGHVEYGIWNTPMCIYKPCVLSFCLIFQFTVAMDSQEKKKKITEYETVRQGPVSLKDSVAGSAAHSVLQAPT